MHFKVARSRSWILAAVALAGAAALARAQGGVDDGLLSRKRLFAEQQLAALAQPFVGVHAAAGVAPGLFPIRATGVSTAPIVDAANAFLAALTPAQTIRTIFAVDDAEWRRWSKSTTASTPVRASASARCPTLSAGGHGLLRASLSAKGLALSQDIMKTDQVLREVNDDALRYDEQLYFVTVMGRPSATEPWGWQIDGHHLIVNYFVLGDQVVMTPVFMGAEPVVATTGKYAGNAVLQSEQDQGLAFMRGLEPAQSRRRPSADKPANDIQAQADSDNLVIDYRGVKASTLPAPLKAQLLALTGLYVGNMRDAHAKVRMSEVAAHLDDTWFAWAGGTDDDAVFYYRIHSPVILIEFDHQMPVGTPASSRGRADARAHPHHGADAERQRLRQGSAAAAPGRAPALSGRRPRASARPAAECFSTRLITGGSERR